MIRFPAAGVLWFSANGGQLSGLSRESWLCRLFSAGNMADLRIHFPGVYKLRGRHHSGTGCEGARSREGGL